MASSRVKASVSVVRARHNIPNRPVKPQFSSNNGGIFTSKVAITVQARRVRKK